MSTHRTAAILSCGDEITLGQTLDTNGRWIADRLSSMGVVPVEHVTLPDDLGALRAGFERLAGRVDLIVSSGGLGPTADDLVRQALAEASGDTLTEDADAWDQIRAWFAARGRTPGELNRVQALRPTRARMLRNDHGTAPGLSVHLGPAGGGCDVFCLPGPPRELFPMFEEHVAPAVRLPEGRVVRTKVLHTFGMGESDIAQKLGVLMDRDRRTLVGTTASMGVVSCRIRYEGPEAGAAGELAEAEAGVRAAVGDFVFGGEKETLASAVLAALRARGGTLACVESCTGGMLGQIITDVPGSSDVFLGGLITYANAMKRSLAGVDAGILGGAGEPGAPGAVSRECAAALALGGLRATGATHALAITGIAGPGGAVPASTDRPGKPVGTVWIARGSADGSIDVRRFNMGGDRESVRRWSCQAALAMLWFALHGRSHLKLLRQAE